MTLDRIKKQLEYAVPEELYQIKKGQVVLFTPKDGIDQRTILYISRLFQYFRHLEKDNNIKMIFVPTDNELLIGAIAGRSPFETDTPRVFVGTWDTVAGFAAGYFNEEIDEIIEQAPRFPIPGLSITKDLPAIVTINPANRPTKKQNNEPSHFYCPFMEENSGNSLGFRLVKPEPGSLTEKKLIKKEEAKLKELWRECIALGIKLEIDKITKEVEDELEQDDRTNYQLIIKTKFNKMTCESCDIYVGEGEEYKINLTPIEKAVYITFLLYDNGIKVRQALLPEARNITKTIYSKMPIDEMNEKMEGILNPGDSTREQQAKTLRSNITYINKAIKQIIPDPLIAQEFCIVTMTNETDSPYAVERTTAEIQEKIRKEFGV